jgi:hypothetical protein
MSTNFSAIVYFDLTLLCKNKPGFSSESLMALAYTCYFLSSEFPLRYSFFIATRYIAAKVFGTTTYV